MEKRTYWSSNPELPVGCRFDPTDQQLILDYLLNKVNNNPLPNSTAVIDCDVYGEGIAWRRLFEESEEDSLFFFTRLKKKTGKGRRVDRVTDCGTWKGLQREKEICTTHGDQRVHIGSKRRFSFIPKKGFQENRGKWVMHEYRLGGCLLDENNLYVVCRINKNKKSKRSNATYDDDDHLDVDVNRTAICVPNDHVFDNYMRDGSKECLNVSDCVAGNGVDEYLDASNCMGGDGTGEFLNGGDGLNVSNNMMGGDGTGDCLNVFNYVGGDSLNNSDYMGGYDIGECLNGGDDLNVSNYKEGNGFGGYLDASNYYMGGDSLNVVFDYIGGDGFGECFNVSDCIGGDGIGECLNVFDYMGGMVQQQQQQSSSTEFCLGKP